MIYKYNCKSSKKSIASVSFYKKLVLGSHVLSEWEHRQPKVRPYLKTVKNKLVDHSNFFFLVFCFALYFPHSI